MLLMIKNHLNGTWFYELLKCYFRVYFKVTQNIYMKTKVQISVYVGSMYYISYFLFVT